MRLTEEPALGLVRLHICLKKIKTQGCDHVVYLLICALFVCLKSSAFYSTWQQIMLLQFHFRMFSERGRV
jgi:hypothetical protein